MGYLSGGDTDVLNVLPTMRAGAIAVQTGLANANARWCNVNYLNFASTAAKDIHVLGDSIQIAPGMPKSGHMANSHAKVAACCQDRPRSRTATPGTWRARSGPTPWSELQVRQAAACSTVWPCARYAFSLFCGSVNCVGVSPGP
jgi:hypothetical protein